MSSSYLFNHETGYDDDGSAMTSFIESAPMDIGDGDKFSLIQKVIPDLTFEGSVNQSTHELILQSKQEMSAVRTMATHLVALQQELLHHL